VTDKEIKAKLEKAHMEGWLNAKERITELERKNNDLAKAYIKALDENQALKEKLERLEQAPEFKVGDRVECLYGKCKVIGIPPDCTDEECLKECRVRIGTNHLTDYCLLKGDLTKLPPDPKPEEVKSLVSVVCGDCSSTDCCTRKGFAELDRRLAKMKE
jgi:hypothetical protein